MYDGNNCLAARHTHTLTLISKLEYSHYLETRWKTQAYQLPVNRNIMSTSVRTAPQIGNLFIFLRALQRPNPHTYQPSILFNGCNVSELKLIL